MIRACIFDLDGTLCDSVFSIGTCFNHVLKEFGLPQIKMERYKILVGDGVHQLVIRALQDVQADETLIEPVQKRYIERFQEECVYQVHPYEGIRDMLQTIKKKGIPVAVLSNKPHENTKKVIRTVFGDGIFDLVQGQVPDIPRKPDPTGALLEAQALGVRPEECLYIGDTATDMRTGNAAGMVTVGVLWGFRDRKELEENHAAHIIGEPMELIPLLDQETKQKSEASR